mgnify:CR=1 FL=1
MLQLIFLPTTKHNKLPVHLTLATLNLINGQNLHEEVQEDHWGKDIKKIKIVVKKFFKLLTLDKFIFLFFIFQVFSLGIEKI